MAVCACLGASTESIAAGLCVDNVMALVYFPLTSMIASKYDDVTDDGVVHNAESDVDQTIINESKDSSTTTPVEALSHAFTLAAVLTALGQLFNSQLHHIPACSSQVNLSLPITTLLAVLYSTYCPANKFLSPTSTTSNNDTDNKPNAIAKAGETLGTTLLYLFFATAGAAGWKLKDSRDMIVSLKDKFSAHRAIQIYFIIISLLCRDFNNKDPRREVRSDSMEDVTVNTTSLPRQDDNRHVWNSNSDCLATTDERHSLINTSKVEDSTMRPHVPSILVRVVYPRLVCQQPTMVDVEAMAKSIKDYAKEWVQALLLQLLVKLLQQIVNFRPGVATAMSTSCKEVDQQWVSLVEFK